MKAIKIHMILATMSKTPNPGVPITGGVPVKIVKHGRDYRALVIPKNALTEAVLRAGREVIITLASPQGDVVNVEARLWRERKRAVYFVVAGPYADYLTELAGQGVRVLLMYNIVPKGP